MFLNYNINNTLFTKLATVAAYAVLPFSLISIPVFCKTFDTCKRSWTAEPRASCGNEACNVNIWRIPSYMRANTIFINAGKFNRKYIEIFTAFSISFNLTVLVILNLGKNTLTSSLSMRICVRWRLELSIRETSSSNPSRLFGKMMYIANL